MRICYWRESQKERDRWEDQYVGGRWVNNYVIDLERWGGVVEEEI
jgi:hypothetical protein